MNEQSCDKGQAIDFLTQYYVDNESIENKSDMLAEENAEKIIEKLKNEKCIS